MNYSVKEKIDIIVLQLHQFKDVYQKIFYIHSLRDKLFEEYNTYSFQMKILRYIRFHRLKSALDHLENEINNTLLTDSKTIPLLPDTRYMKKWWYKKFICFD